MILPRFPQLVSQPRMPIAATPLGTLIWKPVASVVDLWIWKISQKGVYPQLKYLVGPAQEQKKIITKSTKYLFFLLFIIYEQTDLLKVNYFAQPNFQTDNFAQRNGPKMPKKTRTIFKNFVKLCQNHFFLNAYFSIFVFKSRKCAYSQKNAQPCDLTTSTFRSTVSRPRQSQELIIFSLIN